MSQVLGPSSARSSFCAIPLFLPQVPTSGALGARPELLLEQLCDHIVRIRAAAVVQRDQGNVPAPGAGDGEGRVVGVYEGDDRDAPTERGPRKPVIGEHELWPLTGIQDLLHR